MNPTPAGPRVSMIVTVQAEKPLRPSAALLPAARTSAGAPPAGKPAPGTPAERASVAAGAESAAEACESVIGMVKSLDKGAACRSQYAHSG